MTSPTPLTLDQVQNEVASLYGVLVSFLGDDCDRVLAFTHDRRRAIAAARRHIHTEWSEKVTSLDTHGSKWVQVFNTCGCPDDQNPGESCEHYGLPPCSSEFAWTAEPCTPTDLNALPVIEFEWDC